MAVAFVKDTRLMKLLRRLATRYIKKIVKDVALQQKLIPNYLIGCKRILLSNEYYQALIKKNVEVIVDGIAEVNERGILTKDGVQRNIDAIVLATGFQAAEAANAFSVQGKNGKYLNEVWQDGAEAYLGTSVAGFPNFFFVVGPNTGLGHSSMILMIEAQVQYILDGLQYLQKNKLYTADVKAEIQKKYNQDIQEKLSKTVWQNGGCKSWYQTKDGKNVTLWPGFTFTFMNKTRHFEPSKYELS
jgi:cation diffusion facilitator CzcD-associated flavoprotein CzcO